MRSISWAVCTFVMSATFALQVSGAPGESIVLDPNTGDYQITYLGTGSLGNKKNKPLRKTIFVPATKINPAIESSFKWRGVDAVKYSYRLKNGSTSRQSLASFLFDPVSDIVSTVPLPKHKADANINTIAQIGKIGRDSLSTPNGWDGSAVSSNEGGLRIGWMFDSLNKPNSGLSAGLVQDGFGFYSMDIPGIGIAQFRGRAPLLGFVDEGPSGEIDDQLYKLTQQNFVSRNVAVPTIAVPAPFDAATLLDRIRTHVATWPSKQLLDPFFAAQLDRYLAAAADAYRLNNTKAGREHIESLRKLLDREHKYLDHDDEDNEDAPEHRTATRLTIDRLAARVLDFDLRYAIKRTEHEHEHGEGDHRKER